jgi:EAL and modified HD-GYP domain-containing signal transduction protein
MARDKSHRAPEQRVHVGRQAIYDQNLDIVGYELLFRAGAGANVATANGAHATSRVIVNTFTEFGLDQLVGDRLPFINMTREFLVGELPLPFEPGRTVLEVLETIDADDDVVAGVTRLAAEGYPVALDDFAFTRGHEKLLRVASYVKLEVLGVEPALLAAQVAACREYPDLTLVAERLETHEDLELARDLGFHLFQGFLLGRSQILSLDTLTPSRLRHLQLVEQLSCDQPDIDRVTSIVNSDPALALRVLRAANSAASGLRQKVTSVQNALMLLGMNRLRHWLALMIVSDLGVVDEESISSVLVQARFCQALAEGAEVAAGDSAFTVGLLSGLADLLKLPSAELVAQLSLADDLAAAIVGGEGRLGTVLTTARGYLSGDRTEGTDALDDEELVRAYLSAVDWSMQLAGAMRDRGAGTGDGPAADG